MRFFVPYAKTPEIAEHTWETTRKFAEKTTGHAVSDRRIFRIRYRHSNRDYEAEVGKPEPRTGEEVLMILKGNTYLVCTPNRGVLRDLPILIGENEVSSVEEFEPGGDAGAGVS